MTASKITASAYLNDIGDKEKRADAKKIAAMMRRATGNRPVMHGSSIVGYGSYHYKYASGREGDAALVAFSPRGRAFSIYIMPGFKSFAPLMKKLGKHKHGASCLYINRLSDVDEQVLEKLILESVELMRKRYPVD